MVEATSSSAAEVTIGSRLNLLLGRSKQPHLIAFGRLEQVRA
jgi:hypothetical protein